MKWTRTLLPGCIAATLSLAAAAHEDSRGMNHYHGGAPQPEVDVFVYPNGSEYMAINGSSTTNGSWACEKGKGCADCDGSTAEQEDCKGILEEAANSGEPVRNPPGHPAVKPPKEKPPAAGKPGKGEKPETQSAQGTPTVQFAFYPLKSGRVQIKSRVSRGR